MSSTLIESGSSDSALRVGVLVDSLTQPAWVARVIETIRSEPFANLSAVILHRGHAKSASGWLRTLYEWVDAWGFGRDDDALAARDLTATIGNQLLLDCSDPRLQTCELDVILAFGTPPGDDIILLPRYGVWKCRFDGWQAFLAQQPTTTCAIEVQRPGECRVMAWTRAGTDPISFRRGMSRLAWKAAALVTRQLARLCRDGAAVLEQSSEIEAPIRHESSPKVLRAIAGVAWRFIVQKVRDRWMHEHWFIAFRFQSDDGDSNDDYRRFHKIVPPPDRLWADPFVVAEESRALIFIEEMVYAENRGVISVIEARPDGSWSPPRRVLERQYHLSYPCLFRWDEEWYMLPETLESGTIEIYRCVEFPWRWESAGILFPDTRAVDSTIFELGNRWWMYTTTAADGKTFDELSIYHSDSPRGPWLPHRQNPVLSDIVGGRCAGRPFLRAGRLLRAAQNNARRYGHSVQVREIEILTPENWKETEAGTILPDWTPGLSGMHTLNVDGPVTVIDGMHYRWAR